MLFFSGTDVNTCLDVISLFYSNVDGKLFYINNYFLRVNYEDEKCSAKQDSNLHPSVSSRVPLPLDHLHYFLFLSFCSLLRTIIYCLVQDLIKHATIQWPSWYFILHRTSLYTDVIMQRSYIFIYS